MYSDVSDHDSLIDLTDEDFEEDEVRRIQDSLKEKALWKTPHQREGQTRTLLANQKNTSLQIRQDSPSQRQMISFLIS